jgi:hypothetical protein
MVQKAVVVIASQPIFVCLPSRVGILLMSRDPFGMLKLTGRTAELMDSDQLGVVTRAYFAQRSAQLTESIDQADIIETLHKLRSWTISTQVLKAHWRAKWEKALSTWVGLVMEIVM